MMNKWFIDETMANPLNKAPNNGGKEGTKRKHPSLSQKNRTHSGSQRGTKTIMFQSPNFNRKKHIKKKKGWGTWKCKRPKKNFAYNDGAFHNGNGWSSL